MTTATFSPGRLARASCSRSLAAILALLLAVLVCCVQAHAHATLTGTIPADGSVVADPPAAVTLTFNEPVSIIAATLIVPGGDTLSLDDFTATANTIAVNLPADLGQGSHALSWRAVSEDGHPISGTTFFVIGAASAMPVADMPGQDPTIAGLLWGARLVLFVGIFFGVGGAAFRILAELPQAAEHIVRSASIAGLVAVPAVLGLQGLDLLGAGLSGIGDGRAWWLGGTSPYGITLGLAAVALVVGLLTLSLPSRPASKVTAALAILLTGAAISASGHASAADPQWLTKPALFAHVTTIAWWVGALLPLVLLLRQEQRVSAPALIRFSRAIPFAIVPLIVSGAILALIQLGPPGAAWWTPYGQVLAAKLALLVLLFAIASWNRWVLTAPAARGDARALGHMRRGIIGEIVIILAVLGLVSIWRFTPPPRALVVATAAPLSLDLSSEQLHASVTLSSGRVGGTDIEIGLADAGGNPISPRAVRLSLEPESGIIAPIVRAAESGAGDTWRIDGLNLPLAGVWLVEVEVRVSDFELSRVTGTVEIEPP